MRRLTLLGPFLTHIYIQDHLPLTVAHIHNSRKHSAVRAYQVQNQRAQFLKRTRMITDVQLAALSNWLGSFGMVLIVIYHVSEDWICSFFKRSVLTDASLVALCC